MPKKIFFIIIAILFLNFAFLLPTQAEEKSWNFEKWDVDIQIAQDGSFTVREAQTFNFYGNFHWAQRDISKQRARAITGIKVSDETGRTLSGAEVDVTDAPDQVSVKINFDLTDTQKTWIFEYKVLGGLGYFEDHDELYWNAVSSARDVPIKSVDVRVSLPQGAAAQDLTQKLYMGSYGDRDVSTNYEVVDASTLRYWGADVHAYENFTIVAGWSVGLVTHGGLVKVNSEPRAEILIDGEKSGLTTPAVLEENMEIDSGQHAISVEKFGWQIMGQSEQEVTVEPNRIEPVNFELKQTAWFRILKVLPWLIPLLVLIYLIREWQARPRIRKTIIAQYKPPDDLAPAQVCALTHGQPRPRAITAMLIDLAYRGYIKIIEKQEKKWWGKKTDYAFEKMKEFKKDGALADYEETLLHKIFGDKNRVSLDTLKGQTSRQSLSRAFIRIKKNIQDKLKDQEYFKKKSFQSKYVALILLGIFVFVAGTFSFAAAFLVSLPYTLVATGVLLVIGGIILPQPLTTKGLEAKWWALGFKEYLQVAERFRLGACTPETFEKFLSYAIVFGVEDKWAGRFADIYKESPDWYEGQGAITAFNVAAFTKGISSMSGAVASSFSCSESSASGSSGFGGGGSAGGGGGGGGSSAG